MNKLDWAFARGIALAFAIDLAVDAGFALVRGLDASLASMRDHWHRPGADVALLVLGVTTVVSVLVVQAFRSVTEES